MSEKLTLQKRVGQRRAVHRHKGLARARGKIVYGPGEQFFARAARALDKHGAGACRNLRQQVKQAEHGRAAAHDVLKGVPPLKFFLQFFEGPQVLECLYPAHDRAPFVTEQRR